MTLKVSGFPGCCGSAVITNFYADLYFNSKSEIYGPKLLAETERDLEKLFREEIGRAKGPWCKYIGFVHVVLNQHQLMNEPLLIKFGFVKMETTRNSNTQNLIHHYIRVNNRPMEKPVKEKKVKSLFGATPTEIITEIAA